jgi:histidyl-tRNA synthetase
VDEAAQGRALSLARELRDVGASVVTGSAGRSLRAQMRHANQMGARYALVLGAKELASGTVSIRNLETSEQADVAAADVASLVIG